jgi:hypothetical protein
MSILLNPQIPAPTQAIEIDKAIYEMQIQLSSNLSWLDNAYGRAYRKIELREGRTYYYPEIYIGKQNNVPQYYRVSPDDSKALCYFVVSKGDQQDYEQYGYNFLKWDVSIIFAVNLEKIDPVLLQTELFTQHLIRDVRRVITKAMTGRIKYNLVSEEREFSEVFREVQYDEWNNYQTAPMDAFRMNMEIILREDCPAPDFNRCDAIQKNFTAEERRQCVMPLLDFSNDDDFNALSPQQIADLQARIC